MFRMLPVSRIEKFIKSERGLTTDEVTSCFKQYGHNEIIEVTKAQWWALLIDTMRDPMLWFLLGTALLFLFLGNYVEAIILLLAMIPLIGMDLYLHRRTRASTEGLSSRLAASARVKRDGKVVDIPATELVPGDLVLLAAGQNVPADAIMISADSVQVDESTLTGEAHPVRKQAFVFSDDSSASDVPVDIIHWVYAGTRVLTGSATILIVYTGAETLYGEIVRSASHGKHERTPLQNEIGNLVGVLIVAATILCLMLAWIRFRQGFGVIDAVLSAVTLAVAALPEEFPVVFTFFLGVGVFRLAKQRALVRRAVAVENIGRVSCICTDKTGTITEGILHLTHHFPNHVFNEETLLTVASIASRKETGDPLDLAILQVAPSTHLRLATFPFTENRKRETTVWRNDKGALVAATKGAPETILGMCTLEQSERSEWEAKVIELAQSGHKVIACAEREIHEVDLTGAEPERGFNFAGLLAFEDPVREGVVEAIQVCRDSGIHIIMVTGDHPATARAVAQEIGLGCGSPRVIEASELEYLTREKDIDLKQVDVIARAIPSQKLNLVKELQSLGEIVAVTGDGVNDVPALQAADIGFAMGERGTRSARDVAAIVLLDDNFRTLIHAIVEGRQLFHNLKLSFAYLLMIHIPLVVTAALIPLAGYPLLYLPVHIVWLELIIHPTALLVFQDVARTTHLNKFQKLHQHRFFSRREWFVIASAGLVVTLMIIAGYEFSLGTGRNVEHARAMTLMMLSFASVALTIILGGIVRRVSQVMIILTIMLTLLLVQVPMLASFIHLEPLHLNDVAISIASAIVVAVIAGFGKFRRVK